MKNMIIFLFAMLPFAVAEKVPKSAVAPVVKQEVVQTSTACPSSVVEKKALVAPARAIRVVTLPPVGWPDWLVWSLCGVVATLALVVAFLLGRVTGQVHQPQVVAPVVYVQPPPPPDPPRVVRP